MTEATPPSCELGASTLEQRLATLAQLGRDSLIAYRHEGGAHLLHFRNDTDTRKRLDGVVAAEQKCCSFLDLSVTDDGNLLTLSIRAPEDAREMAGGLARAFLTAA